MINQPPTDTRWRILEAAMHLFWEKGYGSTSVADILSRAGVNSGSLYHYFPGKQDVLIAVLDTYIGGIRQMLFEPAWRGVADPIEKVWKLMDGYREALVQTDCTYGCPIGSLALEIHEPDPAVRERLAKNFSNWTDAIEECLDAAGGRVPPGVERRALAEFVLTTMEGGVMLARSYRDIGYFDRAIGELKAHFNRLLRPATSRARRRPRQRKRGKSHA
ncbi:MAG TPA: TetR/AcrR family transcriptional regulator [Steroidobacteraceae bacterium]|nr:TetR/AcrR family transcriptional regulator [Steroidobacteraceae bacterium]